MTALLPPHAGQPVATAGVPLTRARVAVVMIHGRGAGPANILDLVPRIGHPDAAYVAPGATGGTWYPKSFMAPTEENEPGIRCVAAPVRDADGRITAALSVSGTVSSMSDERMSAQYLAGFLKAEIERWAGPIKASGISMD